MHACKATNTTQVSSCHNITYHWSAGHLHVCTVGDEHSGYGRRASVDAVGPGRRVRLEGAVGGRGRHARYDALASLPANAAISLLGTDTYLINKIRYKIMS